MTPTGGSRETSSTHYEVLGVAPDADAEIVRRAYLRAARASHPDTGGDAETFAAVARAWEALSAPDSRARYDAELAGDEPDWGIEDDAPPGSPVPEPASTGPEPGQDGPVDAPAPFDSPVRSETAARRYRRRVATVLGVGLGLLALVTASGVHQVVDQTESGPLETLAGVSFAWVAAVVARRAQRGRRGAGSVVWWAVAALTVAAGGREVTNLLESGGPVAGRAAQVAAILVVVSGWLVLSWRLPRRLDRAHEQQARDVRLALAHLWNDVLAAAQVPSHRLVRVAPSIDRAGRVQVRDLRTGDLAVLVLPPAWWGGFAVLSDAGVVTGAPSTAPAAWSAELAGATDRHR